MDLILVFVNLDIHFKMITKPAVVSNNHNNIADLFIPIIKYAVSNGVIIGGSLGALLFILIMITLAICCCKCIQSYWARYQINKKYYNQSDEMCFVCLHCVPFFTYAKCQE